MTWRAIAIVMMLAASASADPVVSEETMRQAALALHQTAQAPADFEHAADAYAKYLAAYPKAPEALQLHFYRGQILILKLHRWVDGGDEMMIVANSEPPGKLHEEAVLEAIDAYAAAPDDKKLDAAADRFGVLFSSSPHTPSVIFKLARRRYDRQDYREAIKRFALIVERYPHDTNAGAAGDMWLASLAKLQAFDEVETTARGLLVIPAFASRDQQEGLHRLIRDSIRERAEAFEREHDPVNARRAAELFLRIADEDPKADHLDEALYNAGTMFELGNDLARALPPLLRIAEVAPLSQLAPRGLYRAARIEEEFEPARSAATYVQLVARYPKAKETFDALYNAGLMFEAVGDTAHASNAFKEYVKEAATRKDADDVALAIGMLAERAGDDTRAVAAYEDYTKLRTRHRPEAYLRLAQALLRLGRRDRARGALDALHNLTTNKERSSLETEALFTEAEILGSEASDVKLVGPRAQLVAALRERVRRIDKARAAYDVVIDRRDPVWAVAALDRYAHVLEELDRDVVDKAASPVEPGLADTATQLYDYYGRAFKVALENKVLTPYAFDARARLANLRPADYPPEHEARGELRREPAFEPTPIFVIQPRP